LLCLRERLEPLRDVVEALFAGLLRHRRVHGLVLVRLAGDRGLEVLLGAADREAGRGIADRREILQVAVGVAGLSVCRLLEVAGDLGEALDVRLLCEVEVATIRLRLASERVLEVLVRLRSVEGLGHCLVSYFELQRPQRPRYVRSSARTRKPRTLFGSGSLAGMSAIAPHLSQTA